MSKRTPIDPLYNVSAKPLKPRDLRRVQRNALPPVDRAQQFHLDREAIWARRWRNLALFDVVFCAVAVTLIVFAVVMILSLPSTGQAWRF